MEIRLSGIMQESIVDGTGIRYVIFTQGCPHHCEGCHNPETHDFNGGYVGDTNRIVDEVFQNPLLQGITLSGGEPFIQPKPLIEIVNAVKEKGKDVFAYSGFTFEEIVNAGGDKLNLLKLCDFLVDGKFDLGKRSLSLQFRGSSNQRIVDVKQSLLLGKVVEKIF